MSRTTRPRTTRPRTTRPRTTRPRTARRGTTPPRGAPARTARLPLRAVLALSGWVALAATLLPGGAFLRWAPVLLFVTFGPGFALLYPQPQPQPQLRPQPRPEPRPRSGADGDQGAGTRLETLALAAPLSWSLATLVATALFLVSGFSATAFLVSLAAFCTVAALLPGLPLPAATRDADDLTDDTSGARSAGTTAVGTGAATGAETRAESGAATGADGEP